MSIDQKSFIEFYAKQVRDGNTSLFLGAGISASVGYPSWKKLLKPCAVQLGLDIEEIHDFLLLAQYYANEYGYSALKRIINDNISRLEHESSLIDKILELNFRAIWTTNFDKVLETNLSKRNILTNSVFDDKDLANIQKNNRVNIYKLNGDITNLDRIVITTSDMERYETNHELLITFFKRELVMGSFLFLGYSFSDTLVLSCLNSVNRCLGDSANYHFSIMKNDPSPHFQHFIKDLESRYHIRTLLINSYEELPWILEELQHEIKKKNVFFSGVFERLPNDDDCFAEQLCKLLVSELLENQYHIYTGYGRNFGNYLAGSSVQYLQMHNMEIDRYLIMRPFLKSMSTEKKHTHRESMIGDCAISIFMFGQVPGEDGYVNSTGMLKEYQIAKQKGNYIIPIGGTGYTAREIWNDVFDNITLFPYLEKYIHILNGRNPEQIVYAISAILHNLR